MTSAADTSREQKKERTLIGGMFLLALPALVGIAILAGVIGVVTGLLFGASYLRPDLNSMAVVSTCGVGVVVWVTAVVLVREWVKGARRYVRTGKLPWGEWK